MLHKLSGSCLPGLYFLGFKHFEFDCIMAVILCLFNSALSWLHFCSEFLQIFRQGTKLSLDIELWKSSNSVDNFRRYGRLRFQNKSTNSDLLIILMTLFCPLFEYFFGEHWNVALGGMPFFENFLLHDDNYNKSAYLNKTL